MKSQINFPVAAFFALLFLIFLQSCSIVNQNYIACPDFKKERKKKVPEYRNLVWFGFLKADNNKEMHLKKVISEYASSISVEDVRFLHEDNLLEKKQFLVLKDKINIPQCANLSIKKIHEKVSLKPHKSQKIKDENKIALKVDTSKVPCDTIFLKDGTVILAKNITSFNKYDIRFSDCSNSKVFKRVNKINVKKISFVRSKVEPFALLSLLFFILLFFYPYLFILAFFFGIKSLDRFSTFPGKYKGRIIPILVLILTHIIIFFLIALSISIKLSN